MCLWVPECSFVRKVPSDTQVVNNTIYFLFTLFTRVQLTFLCLVYILLSLNPGVRNCVNHWYYWQLWSTSRQFVYNFNTNNVKSTANLLSENEIMTMMTILTKYFVLLRICITGMHHWVRLRHGIEYHPQYHLYKHTHTAEKRLQFVNNCLKIPSNIIVTVIIMNTWDIFKIIIIVIPIIPKDLIYENGNVYW